MTINVKATFNYDERNDGLLEGRLMGRLKDLERMLKMSSKPSKIHKELIFGEYGEVIGQVWNFYVDEFMKQIVLDTVETLDEGNSDWRVWFQDKYKRMACA